MVGGVAGYNTALGTIYGSSNEAKITGELQTGGIAGKSEGTITACTNYGDVNSHPETSGGFSINKLGGLAENISDAIYKACSDSVSGAESDPREQEQIAGEITDTGGIAGYCCS